MCNYEFDRNRLCGVVNDRETDKIALITSFSEAREAVEMQKYVLPFTELDIIEPRLRALMCISDYN